MPRRPRERLTETEQATILVALRVLQDQLDGSKYFLDGFADHFIGSDGLPLRRPTTEDINDLCENVNCHALLIEGSYHGEHG